MADAAPVSPEGNSREEPSRKSKRRDRSPSLSAAGMPHGIGTSDIPSSPAEKLVNKLREHHHGLDIGLRETFSFWTFEDLIRAMDKEPPSQEFAEVVGFFEKRRQDELRKFPARPLREFPLIFPVVQREREEALIALRAQKTDGNRWPSAEMADFLVAMLQERIRTSYPIRQLRFLVLDSSEFDRLIMLGDSEKREVALGLRPAEKTAKERFYSIVNYAIARGASDIHLEPRRDGRYRVRFRIDGVLEQHKFFVDGDIAKELVNVFKIKAPPMRVEEKRLGQDGAITFTAKSIAEDEVSMEQGRALLKYNLRVSTIPTVLGEKVNARLLKETSATEFSLENLSLAKEDKTALVQHLAAPHGLILVTGPTGSGKTTTLYACLRHLNTPDVNISTVEDPVEVVFEDFNQVAVKDDIGRDFARTLKGFMRQDPDIILVGEIRDPETALVAVQAANTGHLVLSTLHTNDSIGALPRLEDLKLSRAKIIETIKLIVAQRLVRKLNPSSAETYDGREELNALFGREVVTFPVTFFRPDPKITREMDGYVGRTLVMEMFGITDEIRALGFQPDASLKDFAEIAVRQGMKPLVVAGLELALSGVTSLAELQRNVFTVNEFRQQEARILKLLVESKAKTVAAISIPENAG